MARSARHTYRQGWPRGPLWRPRRAARLSPHSPPPSARPHRWPHGQRQPRCETNYATAVPPSRPIQRPQACGRRAPDPGRPARWRGEAQLRTRRCGGHPRSALSWGPRGRACGWLAAVVAVPVGVPPRRPLQQRRQGGLVTPSDAQGVSAREPGVLGGGSSTTSATSSLLEGV